MKLASVIIDREFAPSIFEWLKLGLAKQKRHEEKSRSIVCWIGNCRYFCLSSCVVPGRFATVSSLLGKSDFILGTEVVRDI